MPSRMAQTTVSLIRMVFNGSKENFFIISDIFVSRFERKNNNFEKSAGHIPFVQALFNNLRQF